MRGRRVRRGATSRTSRRRSSVSSGVRPTGKAYLTDALIDAVVNEVYERLALSDIGLSADEAREILQPIIEKIAEQYSSRPSKDQIVARIMRSQDKLLELISTYLVETRDELSEEQLEFVVYNGGLSIARYAPKLYRIASRLGREDIIDVLRSRWIEAGLATPYLCPRCGFYALTPSLTCIVCGAEVDEREFKESIGFSKLLEEFADEASLEDIREVVSEGRIAFDGRGLKPPSKAGRDDIVLFLNERDIRFLKSVLERRRGYGADGNKS